MHVLVLGSKFFKLIKLERGIHELPRSVANLFFYDFGGFITKTVQVFGGDGWG